jgi:hypothetical protein
LSVPPDTKFSPSSRSVRASTCAFSTTARQ